MHLGRFDHGFYWIVRILVAATLVLLHWWAFHGTIAAKDTTVAGLRFEEGFTTLTFRKVLAGIRGHFLLFLIPAMGAGND